MGWLAAAAGLVLFATGAAVPRYDRALPGLPLGTFALRGGFGENRGGHFHAGLDLSTGGVVGSRVLAPADGWVERVRSSGVGYGRSVYLRLADGRTLVFGHLDAFAPALAAWVDSTQRASGQYDQDLTPATGRFRFAKGETVAWSGESGAGPPHLHVEIRHGDWALQPLLAGLTPPNAGTPQLQRLALEPLDERSWVARGAAPRVVPLQGAADTVLVEGRVRVVVRSEDQASGGRNTPPWSVTMDWGGDVTEARFDSLSWATDMTEVRAVIDQGRIAGTKGVLLYAPPGLRPRVIRSARPLRDPVGVIEIAAGDPARPLRLVATSPGGATTERTVWLRGPRPSEVGPDTTRVGTGAAAATPDWRFASLPDRGVRVRVTGTPPGLRNVRIERGGEVAGSSPATWDGGGWVAVVPMAGLPDPGGFWLRGTGADGAPWMTRGAGIASIAGADLPVRPDDGFELDLPSTAVYERSVMISRMERSVDDPAEGLRARGPIVHLMPDDLPLRSTGTLTVPLGAQLSPERVALYHREGNGWSRVRATFDAATRSFEAEVPELGAFALFEDDTPPVVTRWRVPRAAAREPYSRWALTAGVVERGSGLDARESFVEVDGARVPTEWDSEQRVLRWRPLEPPAAGAHTFRVVATDRAGHTGTAGGRFVLGSAAR